MERTQLPTIEPQFDARYISAKDVLALLGHGEVTGVNYEDPRIQEIRTCVLGNLGRIGMTAALNSGYLHDQGASLHDARVPLLTAWRWWSHRSWSSAHRVVRGPRWPPPGTV